MKKGYLVLGLAAVVLFLGCPVGMSFAPGDPGKEFLDERIVGTWITADEFSVFKKAEVARADSSSFRVKLYETTDMFVLGDETELQGWTTRIDDQPFLYVLSAELNEYFTYGYAFQNGGIVLYDAALLDGGKDSVLSTESFRNQLAASIKKEEWFAEPVFYQRFFEEKK